jgi:hypothetical protein
VTVGLRAAATSAAVILAVTWPLFTKLAETPFPFQSTVEQETKFEPLTVKVKALPPAVALGAKAKSARARDWAPRVCGNRSNQRADSRGPPTGPRCGQRYTPDCRCAEHHNNCRCWARHHNNRSAGLGLSAEQIYRFSVDGGSVDAHLNFDRPKSAPPLRDPVHLQKLPHMRMLRLRQVRRRPKKNHPAFKQKHHGADPVRVTRSEYPFRMT